MDEKSEEKIGPEKKQRRVYTVAAVGVLTGFIISLLWADHKAHIMEYLPYLIILLCPILHLFSHNRHGKGH